MKLTKALMKYFSHYIQLMLTSFAADSPALRIKELTGPIREECAPHCGMRVNAYMPRKKQTLFIRCK